jgi:hypothetical protein
MENFLKIKVQSTNKMMETNKQWMEMDKMEQIWKEMKWKVMMETTMLKRGMKEMKAMELRIKKMEQ